MNRILLKVIVIAVCSSGKLVGQTVNTGDLMVLPGTTFSTVTDFKNTDKGNLVNDGTFFVYANFHNDGLVAFSPEVTTGITHFKGTEKQTISGTLLSKLNHVKFDNNSEQPAFLLPGEISVNGISEFYQGVVKVGDNGAFIFDDKATHTNTSHNSHVDGFVERHGKKEFQFPIGEGGFFEPKTIGISDRDNAIFKSKYLLENSNTLYPHGQKEEEIEFIDTAEYWVLKSNYSPLELPLTLSWGDNTPDDITIKVEDSEIAIVRWDTAKSKWEYYTTAVDYNEKMATALITDDGVFTLARIKVIDKPKPRNIEGLVVYNGLSGNGDGKNDYFFIDGLAGFPDNTLEIYNRWGVKVYSATEYGSNNKWFRGFSEEKGTVDRGKKLPSGTYFYILTYKVESGEVKDKTGYLYIN